MSAVARVELAVLCHDGTVHYGHDFVNTPEPQRWVRFADQAPDLHSCIFNCTCNRTCNPHRLMRRTVTAWQPVPEPVPESGCPK